MVLIFAENVNGTFKKASFEAVAYGVALSKQIGAQAIAVAFGAAENNKLAHLGQYGVEKVIHVNDAALNSFDAQNFASALNQVASKENAEIVVLANTYTGKAIAPRLAVKMNASLATDVIAMADTNGGFKVKKSIYSNKGFAEIALTASKKVLALSSNSFPASEMGGTAVVETGSVSLNASKTKVESVNVASGKIPLTEAELVVSAGRGLKGPENWGIVEDLAAALGAGTACSKPVSDLDWRPHEEHVGQTGITIRPNLYIACGISGAIQHLAGVSASKVIVAINTDKEAPFFKAAHYGVVGDVFEVLPRLTDAVKRMKAAN